MKSNEKRPTIPENKRGDNTYKGEDKDMENIFNTLTARQKKIFNLLLSRKCSAADISIAFGYSDPRSYFKRMISKGVKIQSAWVDRPDTRFKVYWIEEPAPQRSSTKRVGEIMEQSNFLDVFPKRFNH